MEDGEMEKKVFGRNIVNCYRLGGYRWCRPGGVETASISQVALPAPLLAHRNVDYLNPPFTNNHALCVQFIKVTMPGWQCQMFRGEMEYYARWLA